jgi:hypothetical protein
MAKVKLAEIVGAMELGNEEVAFYLDRVTGAVIQVMDERMEEAGKGRLRAGAADWEREEFEDAKRVLAEPERFMELPGGRELDEWRVMEQFGEEAAAGRVREELLRAIRGSGAFRRFRECVRRHGLEAAWYKHREAAFSRAAVKWCEVNGIDYEV